MMRNSKIYPWIVVFLLWGVGLLNYLDRQMLSTMKDAMMVDIIELESATNFGRLMAVFLWIYGLMSPIAGVIADRMSRKWLITGSLFVWSAVTWRMGYADSFTELYVLRAIMGVSEALYIPSALSMIADFHDDKTRSLAIGIHMTGLYVGQAIGGFGATVADLITWESTFHSFGIIGVLYSLLLVFFLHEKEGRNIPILDVKNQRTFPIKQSLTMLFSMITFWVILLYFSVPSLPGWAAKNWLPTLFSESLSIDMTQAGPLSTITIAASSFAGVIFGGTLSDRWIQRSLRGRIYSGAIGLGLMIPALLMLGMGTTILPVVCGAIFFGVGFGMFDANNMPILCQFVPPRLRATAYGIMNMTGVFAGALITSFLGKSMDGGHLGRDFMLMAVIVGIVLILQLMVLRPKVKEQV